MVPTGNGSRPVSRKKRRAAQAINIGAMVDTVRIFGLLGGHVIDSPHVHTALGQAAGGGLAERIIGVDDPGQAQVEHTDGPPVVDDEVAGLDIAMNDPLFVGGLEAPGGLDQVVEAWGTDKGPCWPTTRSRLTPST